MQIRGKTLFFLFLGIILLWFTHANRVVFAPFVLGAVFAYLVNPIVNFFSHKIKLPRTLAIVIIYIILIAAIIYLGVFVVKRIAAESDDITRYGVSILESARTQVNTLPDWLQPIANETLLSIQQSRILSATYLFTLFPQAISRIVSFIIFAFSGFYFLKDGHLLLNKLITWLPNKYKKDAEVLLEKINGVLSGYLRGQMFLVFLISMILFIILTIFGVKFSLVLAIFSGFAEIVPVIGPIVAGAVAAFVILVTGAINFSLSPLQGALIVALIYFVVRQIQDYFINPYVMHKITKLHPLVVLFAAISGHQLAGILGLILAVPAAATIKILWDFSFSKLNE
ncbi:MAG: AI-2E family transporter [Candidatus Levybacteria bacterium]|nr:AI-2E family transporter [Candidatus Levybacteria bacterium]